MSACLLSVRLNGNSEKLEFLLRQVRNFETFQSLTICLCDDSIKNAITIYFSWDDTFYHVRFRSDKKITGTRLNKQIATNCIPELTI